MKIITYFRRLNEERKFNRKIYKRQVSIRKEIIKLKKKNRSTYLSLGYIDESYPYKDKMILASYMLGKINECKQKIIELETELKNITK